jgi:hypothetical protein
MSLQQAAQHLAAQGRGKDTTLVHMTPNEVRGLQQIAMAAGGSLTLNPSTGLPEAGFLEDMLPMIIGGGLMAMTGGAAAPALAGLTPGMIGLGVGGIQALRTGNLMDGVKAGLGAYGGAGLAGGLMGAGAAEIGMGARDMGVQQATQQGLTGEAYNKAVQNTVAQQMAEKATPFGSLSTGASQMFQNPGKVVDAMGGISGLAKTGLAAAAPMLMAEPENPSPITPDKDMGQRYSYSAGPTMPLPQPNVPRAGSPEQFQSFGREQRYFTPGYTKISADQAKSLYGYAGGGPVEAMSNANAMGANTGYPMADINKGAYATPWQTPIPRNVVNGATDTNIDPMTGEMKFAEGGETTVKYDPGKQQYEAIKQGQSRSPTTQELVNASVGSGRVDSGGGGGGQGGTAGSSGSSGYGDFGLGAIGAGQALSSYGDILGGLAPGGLLAGLIGAGLMSSGTGQLGQAEADAASMGGDFSGHAGFDAGSFGYGGGMGSGADTSGGYGGSAAGDAAVGGADNSGGADGGGSGADGGGWQQGGLTHAYAAGGGYNLGDYSDGGRLLRGPGDGVSDSIPATIGKKQPARLADGEFVVPARIVSELGNGSTEAGARKLYAMMNRIQSARGKTVGKGKVAKNSRAERHLPA